MGIRPKLLRAPFSVAFRFLSRLAELIGGIHLPYTVRVGRRVRIWHHGMLDQIGLLDEGLYTYFDDLDICLRAARAGWATWFVPQSRVTHFEGASTGIATGRVERRRSSYWFQARRRYFLKNYGPAYAALVDAAFTLGFAIWRLRRRIQRKPDTDPSCMLIDSILHSVFCAGIKVPFVENPALREVMVQP